MVHGVQGPLQSAIPKDHDIGPGSEVQTTVRR